MLNPCSEIQLNLNTRAFLLSYGVDCSQVVCGLGPSRYDPSTLDLKLHCDSSLVKAPTALEWLQDALAKSNVDRWGVNLKTVLDSTKGGDSVGVAAQALLTQDQPTCVMSLIRLYQQVVSRHDELCKVKKG